MKIKEHKFIILNKPKGFISALNDNRHPCLIELINEKIRGLHIVGRLDKDTTGLIILTTDGNYTHKSTSPKTDTPKGYEVVSKYPVDEIDIKKFANGITIDKGKYRCKSAKLIKVSEKISRVFITEGKYHQVKKMFFNIDNEVIELHRFEYDGIKLDNLEINLGEYKIYDNLDNIKEIKL